MRYSYSTGLSLLLALIAVGLTPLSSAAQDREDDAIGVYRAYLAAVERAHSLEGLSAYMSAEVSGTIADLPEEEGAAVLEMLREESRGAPSGEWEVVEREMTDERAELVIRGALVDDDAIVRRQSTVSLRLEAGDWKLERAGNWSTVEVLPAVGPGNAEPPPPGPGTEEIGSDPYQVTAYAPAATAAGAAGQWEGSVVFDPRGHLVAVTDGRSGEIRLLELDSLREKWSAQTDSRGFSFTHAISFRWDGRALATLAASGSVPEVLPLAANLEGARPDAGYFFSRPALTEAAAAIPGRPKWVSLASHPTEPVLALGQGDYDDEGTGAVVFQPTGAGLWLPGVEAPRAVWPTDSEPWSVTWAPDGGRLAWQVPTLGAEHEAPVYVRDYPEGEAARALSRAGFVPVLGGLVFSPDGRRLAAKGSIPPENEGSDWDVGVAIWDATSVEDLKLLRGVDRVAFAPDGEHLFAVRHSGMALEAGVGDEILVWRLGVPEPGHAISAFPPDEEHPRPRKVAALGVSPNGRFLIAVSNQGDVRLWDAEGGAGATAVDHRTTRSTGEPAASAGDLESGRKDR